MHHNVLALVTLLVGLTPAAALACNCPTSCEVQLFVGEQVAQDTEHLLFHYGPGQTPSLETLASHISLTRDAQDAPLTIEPVPNTTRYIARLPALTPGERWELRVEPMESTGCPTQPVVASFTVSDARPTLAPMTLTQIVEGVTGQVSVVQDGGCPSRVLGVEARVRAELPAALAPLASAMEYEWLVDGEPYRYQPEDCAVSAAPFRTQASASLERALVAVCAPSESLSRALTPGTHDISIRTWWADDPETSTSSAPMRVTLTCAQSDAGCATTPARRPGHESLWWVALLLGFGRLKRRDMPLATSRGGAK